MNTYKTPTLDNTEPIVSISEKAHSHTNMEASRQLKEKQGSLPVNVGRKIHRSYFVSIFRLYIPFPFYLRRKKGQRLQKIRFYFSRFSVHSAWDPFLIFLPLT